MRNRKIIASAAMSAALLGGVLIGATLGNPLTSGAEGGSKTTTTTTTGPDTPPMDGHHGGRGGPGGFELDAAAKVLKLSTDELRTKMRSGMSLAAIAKAQGVPKQDLIDALVKAGNARLDEAKKALPETIAKMVDATPPTGGPEGKGDRPGFPGGPGAMRGGGLEAAAKALGMSVDDLHTALEGGKTLAQVAKDKGVAKQKVIDALVAQAKAHLDQAVKAGKLTKAEADKRLAEMTKAITTWVTDGKAAGDMGPMGGHHGGPGMGGPGFGGPGMGGDEAPGAPGAPGN